MPSGVYDRKNTLWTDEVRKFVIEHADKDITIEAVRRELNSTFGLAMSYMTIKGFYYRYKLPFKRNTRHNRIMTDEEAEYMATIIPGRQSNEIARIMNEKYGIGLTADQVRSWKKNHKCPSGYDTKYRPGEPSWITGKRFPGRTNSGCWSTGHIAFNNVPIGTIRKHGGYWHIKTRDGKKNNNWTQYHRYIWEKEHGPVPEGHKLIFRDGNKDNVSLDNLVCISIADAAVAVMHYGLTDDPDINDAILKLTELNRKTAEKAKGGKE